MPRSTPPSQRKEVPRAATHLVVSAGGNNAIMQVTVFNDAIIRAAWAQRDRASAIRSAKIAETLLSLIDG